MRTGRSTRLAVACFVLVALSVGRAFAADTLGDLEQKATTAFALGRFAEAGGLFEQAFEVKPGPALLYDAAQSYRLAGNKERALVLYENYLRVYGGEQKRAEVESRIDELEKAIAHDEAIAKRPPNEPERVGSPAASSEATPPAAVASAPTLTLSPPPPSGAGAPALVGRPSGGAGKERPLVSRPWFWGVISGAVVTGIVVAIVVAAGSGSTGPTATVGKVNGN
jgi:tetratricopeptide (TPR) repeat protein